MDPHDNRLVQSPFGLPCMPPQLQVRYLGLIHFEEKIRNLGENVENSPELRNHFDYIYLIEHAKEARKR